MSLDKFVKKEASPVKVEASNQVGTQPSIANTVEYPLEEKQSNGIPKGCIRTPRGNVFPALHTGRFKKATNENNIQERRFDNAVRMFPLIDDWVKAISSSKGTQSIYATNFIDFCIEEDIRPDEFGSLIHGDEEQDKAIDLASHYIQKLLRNKKINRATEAIKSLKSFYRFASKGRKTLNLDTQRGGVIRIKSEDKEMVERPRTAWGTAEDMRIAMFNICGHTRDHCDRMAITFLHRTGCRTNVLTHLKIKHIQNRYKEQNPITGEQQEILCLTVIGYNPTTKEGLCEKTFHYGLPRLEDDPEGRHGYYTFLAGDSLELLDQFLKEYHQNPQPEDYVFYNIGKNKSDKPLATDKLNLRFKTIAKSLGYNPKKIWLHQLKEIATTIIESSLSREGSFRAEFLTGHKLDKVKEHYHKRNKKADGQAYLTVQWLPEDKDARIKELEHILAVKDEEVKKVETKPEPQLEPEKPSESEPSKSEPITPIQVMQNTPVVKEPETTIAPNEPAKEQISNKTVSFHRKLRACLKADAYVLIDENCDKCRSETSKVYVDCYKRRARITAGMVSIEDLNLYGFAREPNSNKIILEKEEAIS